MESVLLPNPEGCECFERHQFKRERCKNCGKRWQEHLGVISDEIVQEYLKEQAAADARRQREAEEKKAEAQAKALAKKVQKKKLEQAPEDDWLFSDGKDGDGFGSEEEEEGGIGFKMLEGGELDSSLRPEGRKVSERTLKVVNLIDFGECDVYEEEPAGREPAAPAAPVPNSDTEASDNSEPVAQLPISEALPPVSAAVAPMCAAVMPVSMGPNVLPDLNEEDLLSEIELLRQRLQDADMERSVQVSIVRDEVDEKQRIIDELESKHREAEKALHDALGQVERLRHERDAAAAAAAAAQEAAEARRAAEAAAAAEAEAAAKAAVALRPPEAEAEAAAAAGPAAAETDVALRRPEAEATVVKQQTADPELQLEPRRNGPLWKLLEQSYWLKCLRPSDLSDTD